MLTWNSETAASACYKLGSEQTNDTLLKANKEITKNILI